MCKSDKELDQLLLDNIALVFNRFKVITQPETTGCPCVDVETDNGFSVCVACGREKRDIGPSPMARRHMYKCVHYMSALLKSFELRDRRVPRVVMQQIKTRWLMAGSPPLTKHALQRIMRTRQSKVFRPYLRSWRQIAWRLTGIKPPTMSKQARTAFVIMFVRLHTTYSKLGYYNQRSSFLSFPFVFRRCMELLGCDHLREHFPGLRGPDKFAVHYGIYAAVCRASGLPIIVTTF